MIPIRAGTAADIEPLLDVWEALMACGTEADPRFRMARGARPHMRDYMRSWFAPQPFPPVFLAEHDGALVGAVRGFPSLIVPVVERAPTVRIGDLYVADAYRRQGLARRLVDTLLLSAREAGYPRAEVGTLTLDARAVAFWKGVGFGDWMVTLSREPESP
ncbi:MAG: GNAT family N-acetyltransferase [Myxococcota bacterium]